MGTLEHRKILRLHEAVFDTGLGVHREALLCGIEPQFRAGLPIAHSNISQVLCDLDALNFAGKLKDGSLPLMQWLMNAGALAKSRPAGAVFREMLGELEEHQAAQHQLSSAYNESAPLQFASIVTDPNDTNWSLAPTSSIFGHIDVFRAFGKTDLILNADPTLDVTIINKRREPVLLTGLGVKIISIAMRVYICGIPSAGEVYRTASYTVEIADVVAQYVTDEQRDLWQYGPVDIDHLFSVQMPNPVYLEGLAPYRLALFLKDFDRHLPNHCCLSLFAATSEGDVLSSPIEIMT